MDYDFTFKDLSILLPKQQTFAQKSRQQFFKRILLIDDDPTNLMDNPDNGIPITPFFGDNPHDTSLSKALQLVQQLQVLDDVRPVLRKRFGLAAAVGDAKQRHAALVPSQWEHVLQHAQTRQL